MLLWYEYATDPYESLMYGLENHRENILVISYDDIVNDTINQIARIYKFLEIPEYTHTFNDISNTCNEAKDVAWGFEGLHNIRSSISKTSNDPKTILGKDLFEFFTKFDNQLMLIE
jgi:hypothetical protein